MVIADRELVTHEWNSGFPQGRVDVLFNTSEGDSQNKSLVGEIVLGDYYNVPVTLRGGIVCIPGTEGLVEEANRTHLWEDAYGNVADRLKTANPQFVLQHLFPNFLQILSPYIWGRTSESAETRVLYPYSAAGIFVVTIGDKIPYIFTHTVDGGNLTNLLVEGFVYEKMNTGMTQSPRNPLFNINAEMRNNVPYRDPTERHTVNRIGRQLKEVSHESEIEVDDIYQCLNFENYVFRKTSVYRMTQAFASKGEENQYPNKLKESENVFNAVTRASTRFINPPLKFWSRFERQAFESTQNGIKSTLSNITNANVESGIGASVRVQLRRS